MVNCCVLECRSNQITVIPDEISVLNNLSKLDLSHNKIQSLPYEMVKLTNLITLDLNGNPLMGMPNSIIQGGVGSIFEYLVLKEKSHPTQKK